jgi:hypothetical protein
MEHAQIMKIVMLDPIKPNNMLRPNCDNKASKNKGLRTKTIAFPGESSPVLFATH